MLVPDIDRCLELMDTYAMWENIRHHSFKVAQVSAVLQQNLASQAIEIDYALVIAGALLHDIAKSKCLEEGCSHAMVGGELVYELGYPEVADIVTHHVILADFDPDRYDQGGFTATDIVFYADKRVKHDQIVSLDERLEYIMDKYANDSRRNEELILKNFTRCRTLENFLFSKLHFSSDALESQLSAIADTDLSYPSR